MLWKKLLKSVSSSNNEFLTRPPMQSPRQRVKGRKAMTLIQCKNE